MKYIILLFTLLKISAANGQADAWSSPNLLPDKYKIDGSVSFREVVDTAQMKHIVRHRRFLIKASDRFTYVGIRSNSSTILNAYLISPERISVFHASAALGQIDLKKEGEVYLAEKTEFDWIYRDPASWEDKPPEAVNTIEEFFERFGWMANVWQSGSYREMEMIIDNKHLAKDTQLVISYTSREDAKSGVRFNKGREAITLSGDDEIDKQLHNGYIPEELSLSLNPKP